MTEWYIYFGLFAVGVLAGAVNTLAGNGSLFSLSAMLFIGIPVDIANATNRIGVLGQSMTASYAFIQAKQLKIKKHLSIFIIIVFSAVVGVWIATVIERRALSLVMGAVMLVLLFLMIFEPHKKYLKANPLSNVKILPLFIVVGLYGGFIQAGVGVFIMVSCYIIGMSSLEGSSIKILSTLVYTILCIIIFMFEGTILWDLGVAMGLGQMIGAKLASKWMLNAQTSKLDKYIRYLLIAMAFGSVIKIVSDVPILFVDKP